MLQGCSRHPARRFYFAVSPGAAGACRSWTTPEVLEMAGRTWRASTNVGAQRPFEQRPRLMRKALPSRDWLLSQQIIP